MLPSVSLVLVPSVSDVPLVCETPADLPSVQPWDFPSVSDRLTLVPSVPPPHWRPKKKPGVQFRLFDELTLRPVELLTPQDFPVLTELFVPSDSDVP